MTDISWLAKSAYDRGVDPITYAGQHVAIILKVHQAVTDARRQNPATFPVYCLDLTHEAVARRIVGELLDAGWTPPEVPS